jgi:hypothetical protein
MFKPLAAPYKDSGAARNFWTFVSSIDKNLLVSSTLSTPKSASRGENPPAGSKISQHLSHVAALGTSGPVFSIMLILEPYSTQFLLIGQKTVDYTVFCLRLSDRFRVGRWAGYGSGADRRDLAQEAELTLYSKCYTINLVETMIKIRESALKRGITEAQILQVIADKVVTKPIEMHGDGEGNPQEMLVGYTQAGVLLEVAVRYTSECDEIFHASRVTAKFRKMYEES